MFLTEDLVRYDDNFGVVVSRYSGINGMMCLVYWPATGKMNEEWESDLVLEKDYQEEKRRERREEAEAVRQAESATKGTRSPQAFGEPGIRYPSPYTQRFEGVIPEAPTQAESPQAKGVWEDDGGSLYGYDDRGQHHCGPAC